MNKKQIEEEFDKQFLIDEDGHFCWLDGDNASSASESDIKQFIFKTISKVLDELPNDDNPSYGGLINFASWGVENTHQAFQEGFRRGYLCHQEESKQKRKEMGF